MSKTIKIIKHGTDDYELEITCSLNIVTNEDFEDHSSMTDRVNKLKQKGYTVVNDHNV